MQLEVWGEVAWAGAAAAADAPPADALRGDAEQRRRWQLVHAFQPFDGALLSRGATTALIGGVVDGRDKLRAGAARALSLLPIPLPGLETPAALLPLLVWARQLLLSPRMRESDAGARIVKLIFEDYVIRLGWRVTLWPEPSIQPPAAAVANGAPAPAAAGGSKQRLHPDGIHVAIAMLRSLCWKAEQQVDLATLDLAAACRHGLAHGPLLAIRYACEGLPWAAAAAAAGGDGTQLRAWVGELLELLKRVASVATPPLARQDQNVTAGDVDEEYPEEEEEEEEGDEEDEQAEEETPAGAEQPTKPGVAPVTAAAPAQAAQQLGPVPQVVSTGCWTSLKEVACTAMTLVSHVPLPGAPVAAAGGGGGGDGGNGEPSGGAVGAVGEQSGGGGSGGGEGAQVGSSGEPPGPDEGLLLPAPQLEALGSLLVRLLLQLKHNGAVDKVQQNFALLCGRLLRSEATELRRLPGGWLDVCLESMVRPGERCWCGFGAFVISVGLFWGGGRRGSYLLNAPITRLAITLRCIHALPFNPLSPPTPQQAKASTTSCAAQPASPTPSWHSSWRSPLGPPAGCCPMACGACWGWRGMGAWSRGRGCVGRVG